MGNIRVLIDWSREFDDYLTRLEESAAAGNVVDRQRLDLLLAELQVLADLGRAPQADSATLKRVRQSRRYVVWRVSHPYREGVAVRLIVWFPDDEHVGLACFPGTRRAWGMCSTTASGRAPMLRSRRGNSRPRLREVRADE
ncbi:hypothetical protein [Gordonia mangrovi]|uniref:hypothetical protein n=1 Tax=Gordonia mangrovi TaxID=2665643 RepID=UPI001F1EBD7F|nr:hypothetical protein [Gordonia mangrovi]UVF79131.1 hypothetical protein NWF22_04580 [Gordonia mangrovi]